MTDLIEATTENARAQWHYPPIHVGILPNEADQIQLRIADRMRRTIEQHTLEVIADLGRVFDAENPEPAVEALGRLLVHASLVASCSRMAIAPIIALGRALTKDSGVSNELPLKPASALAQVVLLAWRDDSPGVVRGLSMAIAKAIDDCEIVHELKIDPLELFKVAARELLDGVAYPRTSEAIAGVKVIVPQVDEPTFHRRLGHPVHPDHPHAVGRWEVDPAIRPSTPGQNPTQRASWFTGCNALPSEPCSGPCCRETPPPPSPLSVAHKAAVRAEAWAQLRQASGVIVADEQAESTTPITGAGPTLADGSLFEDAMREQIKTMLGPAVSHAELDAAALAVGPPGAAFERAILPDPGNPGGQGAFGEHPWPPDHRWETDEEFRVRIKAVLSSPDGKLPACHGPTK